jgi:hypothetical protein
VLANRDRDAPRPCPGTVAVAARLDRGSGDDKDSAGCRRWGALLCGAPGEVFQDAADQTRLGDEGDHAHNASAAGTDERIDLVDPSDELGPSTAQGGQSWGRRRRLPARSWRERLRPWRPGCWPSPYHAPRWSTRRSSGRGGGGDALLRQGFGGRGSSEGGSHQKCR